MDIIAHGLWAGAGTIWAQRYRPIPRGTTLAIVAMAVLPDIPHLLPVVGWWLFGDGATPRAPRCGMPDRQRTVKVDMDQACVVRAT